MMMMMVMMMMTTTVMMMLSLIFLFIYLTTVNQLRRLIRNYKEENKKNFKITLQFF
ncbi:unnamed protein product [Enterobius vermicularis]|uniref:Uncharacterized protein n=1 Tax=Enterobius vermicularis TaxID=51028 RepID=A0A0N4VCC2_ENTVE|nr:unnamed protein product [Enterobius vermicularis]